METLSEEGFYGNMEAPNESNEINCYSVNPMEESLSYESTYYQGSYNGQENMLTEYDTTLTSTTYIPTSQNSDFMNIHNMDQGYMNSMCSMMPSGVMDSSCGLSPSVTNPQKPKRPTKPRSKPKCPAKRKQQRSAANVRERKRMQTINEAFDSLKDRIPLASQDRRLSKVDTLRLAIRYIHHLQDTVHTLDSESLQQMMTSAHHQMSTVHQGMMQTHQHPVSYMVQPSK